MLPVAIAIAAAQFANRIAITYPGGFAVALRHAVRLSHLGHHIDGKGIPDSNAMPCLLQNNINALTLRCQYDPHLCTEGQYHGPFN